MKKVEKVLKFENAASFEKWLRVSANGVTEAWLQLFKKDSGRATFTYQEALEVALCYGWIDGQKKSYDAQSWIQRFTPRRRNSTWSKRNTLIVEKLIAEKRMRPEGLRLIKEAKADGRWEIAYASPKDMKVPADFMKRLRQDKAAAKKFESLKKAERYSIAFGIETARTPETRERRIVAALKKLK